MTVIQDLDFVAPRDCELVAYGVAHTLIRAWATPVEQGNNTSRNRRLTIGGFSGTLTEHARRHGIDPWVFRDRIERGWSAENALSAPVANQRRYMRKEDKRVVFGLRVAGLTIAAIADKTQFSKGAIGRFLRSSAWEEL